MDACTIAMLLIAGLSAGFIDSIAGGGGLISVPALMWAGLPPHLVLGTNKMQSSFGTAAAVMRYSRAGLINWKQVRVTALITFLFAGIGALTVTQISNASLQMVVPWMLLAVALYTLLSPRMGIHSGHARLSPATFSLLAGSTLGFYDGFFGPGTGSFWTLACIGLLGLELTRATAFTKVVNLSSNLASLLIFVFASKVRYDMAAVMIAGQIAGARMGSSLVIRHGAPFVRMVFLIVIFVMIIKLLWDQSR
jgi:uncharacterized protein